jgi:hypothetical protein
MGANLLALLERADFTDALGKGTTTWIAEEYSG